MILTNQKIYDAAIQLSSFYIEGKLPVRVNFFLQKNIQMIAAAGQEIEQTRVEIARSFGEYNEESSKYIVPPEKISEAQKELSDLFSLEQDLNLHIFQLDDFDDIELTTNQLSAIMFMIADPEEEEEDY